MEKLSAFNIVKTSLKTFVFDICWIYKIPESQTFNKQYYVLPQLPKNTKKKLFIEVQSYST